ncbi:MAG: sigma-54 dependent transcriptional regulator [Verrucomicrobiales bacterium]|nr:sigma-54 dependent transcriptional regulator [Verrucomicrobiales bacterium]
MKSILIVEDDTDLRSSISEILISEGFEVTQASTGQEGLDEFEKGKFDIVLTDFRLPEMGGLALIERIREKTTRIPVVLMTAYGTTNLAIEATQKGAFDYLIKPFKSKDLIDIVSRALQTSRMTGRPVEFKDTGDFGEHDAIIGNSRGMQAVYREIGKVADKNVTVLIQGETGTGKELIARAVFQHSAQKDDPFVAVNCTAIPDNLLESELFGHEKGSFTGAVARRIGRFEQADGGTLFLDEIGDMTQDTQVKMLRVLQEKTIRRVGGDTEIPVKVRVIAATHQNLEKAVAEGRFREDLYFRINTAIIELPPLRERKDDIDLLIQHFVKLYCNEFGAEPPKFGKGVKETLLDHTWPGNVRELENVTRKMIIKSNGYPLSKQDIEQFLTRSNRLTRSDGNNLEEMGQKKHIRELLLQAKNGEVVNPHSILVEELEREMIYQALEICNTNQSSACKLLGISRATFREKMERFGLLPSKK